MEALILFAIIFVVSRLLNSGNKKNSGNRQQQAIEEQRRRRAAWEAAQRAQGAGGPAEQQPLTLEQTMRMFIEEIPEQESRPAVPPHEKHHIDDIEEERCAEAEKARQERRKAELRERFGAPQRRTQLQGSITDGRKRPELAVAPALSLSAISAPQQQPRLATAPPMGADKAYFEDNMLVQGIIMAEILGPPRAKRRLQR